MEEQKRRQVEYHEREHYRAGRPRQADDSNAAIAWINGYRIRKMTEMMGASVKGKTILSVCGGDGEEADFLQRQGARVTMIDLSPAGVQAAQNRNPALRCLCMDAEALAFSDASFDWTIVREGLHHLARPLQGLYEMERVAREGFAFMEGQDSLAVRLLVSLGLGEVRDPAGGYVYRFSRREIHKIFSSLGTIASWRVHTAWIPYGSDALKHFVLFRRLANPLISHPMTLRLLAGRGARWVLKSLFRMLQFLTGHWGNCLIVVAWKKPGRAC